MPYITEDRRTEQLPDSGNIDIAHNRRDLGIAVGRAMDNGGDLQYMIAEAIQTYLEDKGLRYAYCEEIMGALTGANDEFYRCVVAPYEKQKSQDNGRVYKIERMTSTKY
jgi:hypothetical protein